VRADALLLNFKAVTYTFVPDAGARRGTVLVEPPLAAHMVERSVPLAQPAPATTGAAH
jgi:hypothetical protein